MSDMSEVTSREHMWCKICGITNVTDARMVAELGADAIGLNFWSGSKRHINIKIAREVCQSVDVTKVGLFVDAGRVEVEAILAGCDLDVVQFHGAEPAEFCRQFDRPYIKALSADEPGVESLIAKYPDAWAIMLDASRAGRLGGTGHVFDWRNWPKGEIAQNLILAGGLDPNNVADGVAAVSPWGVDVSTGVEKDGSNARAKDRARVREFICQAGGGHE